MKTSVAMDEIRKIRDENSLRHLSQTPKERRQELKDSMDWFTEAMDRPVQAARDKMVSEAADRVIEENMEALRELAK